MESPIISLLPRGHRMDRQFGIVYDQSPSGSDDLTEIDGIRTREAVLLNQLGIYFFGQIALWRHRELAAISSEMQMPISRIIDEGWIEQARSLCHPSAPAAEPILPASIFRTVTLLTCALVAGFLLVHFLGQRRNEPLTGILSADITSICVPAPSRMTEVHVKSGDKVFSGQPLLSLEKLEHLELLKSQEHLVQNLEREIRRMEAQAAIEVEWRTRDLDRELSGLRTQVAQREAFVRDQIQATSVAVSPTPVSQISSQTLVTTKSPPRKPTVRRRPGGLMFFSASASEPLVAAVAVPRKAPVESPDVPLPAPEPEPIRLAVAPNEAVIADTPAPVAADAQLESLRNEQGRLESVRASLPGTVSDALGVGALKAHYAEAFDQLEKMKSASREVLVNAPVYGVVGQVRYSRGDDLKSGEVMLKILHAERYIVVHMPTRRIHEMQTGREVELVFPGREVFRGQIVEIPMMADTAAATGEPLASVRIEPVGRVWPTVPVGSQIDVISLK